MYRRTANLRITATWGIVRWRKLLEIGLSSYQTDLTLERFKCLFPAKSYYTSFRDAPQEQEYALRV